MKKAAALLLGVLAAGTVLSFAQGDGQAKDRGRPGPRGDRPGPQREVTEEQRAKLAERREAMKQARETADTNGNGKIDEGAEQEALAAAMKLVLFDANGNGKIDEGAEQERADRFHGLQNRRGPRGDGDGEGRRGPRREGERPVRPNGERPNFPERQNRPAGGGNR